MNIRLAATEFGLTVDGNSSIPYSSRPQTCDYGITTKGYWYLVAPATEDGKQALGGHLLLCITTYDLYGFVYEIPQHASFVS